MTYAQACPYIQAIRLRLCETERSFAMIFGHLRYEIPLDLGAMFAMS